MKFKALSYIGLAWLENLGIYDTKEEAIEALQAEYEESINDPMLSVEDQLNIEESYWFNSRIEEI